MQADGEETIRLQWNVVNTTTFGPWKFVRMNGVVLHPQFIATEQCN